MSLLGYLADADYGRAAPAGARSSGAAGQRQSAPTTRDEGILSATFRAEPPYASSLLAAPAAYPPLSMHFDLTINAPSDEALLDSAPAEEEGDKPQRSDPTTALSPDAQEAILKLLPADTRLRCREARRARARAPAGLRCFRQVSRAWSRAAGRGGAWAELDLSIESGVTCRRPGPLLDACLARAAGSLRSVNLTGCKSLNFAALLRAAEAGGAQLAMLRCAATVDFLTPPQVFSLLACCPRLRLLECDVKAAPPDALRLLRRSSPFAPVLVRELWVDQPQALREREADIASLAAAARDHPRLASLLVQWLPLRQLAAAEALVQAAMLRRLTFLYLVGCSLTPAHLPPLTALLRAGALEQLWISNSHAPLFDGDTLPDFCAALRAAPRLARLTLCCSLLWHAPTSGAQLLGALRGRPALRELDLSCNEAPGGVAQRAAGEALAALLAAPGGRLEALSLDYNNLGDAGMRPLFAAVRGSQCLRRLVCTHNNVGADGLGDRLLAACLPRAAAGVARACILPAVRANASLRQLRFGQPGALAEAEELVLRRAPMPAPAT